MGRANSKSLNHAKFFRCMDYIRQNPDAFVAIGAVAAAEKLTEALGFEVSHTSIQPKDVLELTGVSIYARKAAKDDAEPVEFLSREDAIQLVCAVREFMDEIGYPKSKPESYQRVRNLHLKLSSVA
jgi:hypothetical protein